MKLNVFAVDIQRFLIKLPWFLQSGIFGTVIAEQRGEATCFHPAAQQLRGGVFAEPANVGAHDWHTGESQIEKLWNRHLQVRPQALIVTGPCRGVFLGSAVACTGDDERSAAILLFEAFIGCLGHKVSIDIVNFLVQAWMVIPRKYYIIRERPVETGWFIHVVPDAADSVFYLKTGVFTPPVPDGL